MLHVYTCQIYSVNASIGMAGKSALVTGSTSGIGTDIARTLASHGYNVILTGSRDKEEVVFLVEDIKTKHGVQADYVAADLTKLGDVDTLWQNSKQLYPEGIDVLVNNAGYHTGAPVEELTQHQWDSTMALMLTAPFLLTQKCLPDMRTKGWGRIINISSIFGLVARKEAECAYVSAKHGLIGLTKAVALEAAGSGVTCNAVCPGVVDTPSFRGYLNTVAKKTGVSLEEAAADNALLKDIPTKKYISTKQVADMVAFLCTESADQVTGTPLVMDGGYLAQ